MGEGKPWMGEELGRKEGDEISKFRIPVQEHPPCFKE